MKTLWKLLLLLPLFVTGPAGKGAVPRPSFMDTVDYWHVKFNGKLTTPAYDSKTGKLSFTLPQSISETDVLSVHYYTDTPCHECPSKLEIRDNAGNVLRTINVKGFGTGAPAEIRATELKAFLASGKGVELYYSGTYYQYDWTRWVFIVSVELNK